MWSLVHKSNSVLKIVVCTPVFGFRERFCKEFGVTCIEALYGLIDPYKDGCLPGGGMGSLS
ncbi:MAG: hypothetical protein KAU52_01615 [Methanosarcinales archaeon]|nr:hypothetical protein [Methanosarcinales archaeon]